MIGTLIATLCAIVSAVATIGAVAYYAGRLTRQLDDQSRDIQRLESGQASIVARMRTIEVSIARYGYKIIGNGNGNSNGNGDCA